MSPGPVDDEPEGMSNAEKPPAAAPLPELDRALLERIAQMSRFVDDLVLLASQDGRVAAINDAALAVLGLSRPGAIGLPLDSIVQLPASLPPAGTPQVPEEAVWRNTQGRRFAVEWIAHVIELQGQRLTEVIARDVSASRAAAAALRSSEQRFRDLTEMSSDWYWEQDAQFRFTSLSEGLRRVGLDPERFLGKTRWDAPGLDQLPFVDWATHRRCVEAHLPFDNFEYCRRAPNGERVWQTVSGRPVFDAHGNFQGYRGIGHNITERKRAEEQLRRLNASLEERVRARTRDLEAALAELESFSYSVSHDLRAPLRTIDGFSAALAQHCAGQLDAEAQGYLQRTRAAAQRMGELIDDLLQLSRVGRAEISLQTVNLSSIATDLARELSTSDPARKVEWVIAPNLRAEGDPLLLRLVLQNLLANAWKYTAKHPSARIEFGGNPGGDRAFEFFVRDDGAGFDMAHANRLFGAFQRLHRQDDFPGTGVGLAIVHRIISRHGGQVRAEAAVEHGATFFFTLKPPTAT